MKNIAAVVPRGSEQRKSNNADKHDHGQEERKHSTYVEGKTAPDTATSTLNA